jgi:hypothetical protein
VNDSDSDDGSFSELSNSETYEANSPFSSSSSEEAEEETLQPEPDTVRKRTHRAIPKCANTDLELGWIENIGKIQKPAFSRVPGINKNYQKLKTALPWTYLKYSSAQTCFSTKKLLKDCSLVLAQDLKYKVRPAVQQAGS